LGSFDRSAVEQDRAGTLVLTHNPWVVLQTASRTKLKALQEDREFRDRVNELAERQRQILKRLRAAHRQPPNFPKPIREYRPNTDQRKQMSKHLNGKRQERYKP
jgi:nitrate reductase cytochrome c-type subunit